MTTGGEPFGPRPPLALLSRLPGATAPAAPAATSSYPLFALTLWAFRLGPIGSVVGVVFVVEID